MKEFLGIIAIILTFIGFVPYVKSILENKTKPHVFSWIIWGIATLTVFAAQVVSDAGAGSWSIGLSGVVTIGIAILAYNKQGDYSITKSDWASLIAALSALPFWYFTANPLFAVIILTTVDLIGYLPTLRKAYFKPSEEQITLFVIMSLRNVFSLAALEVYSLTNGLFQIATIAANLLVIGIVIWRRLYQERT